MLICLFFKSEFWKNSGARELIRWLVENIFLLCLEAGLAQAKNVKMDPRG